MTTGKKWMVPSLDWIKAQAAEEERNPALVLREWLRQNAVPRDEWQAIGDRVGLYVPVDDSPGDSWPAVSD